MELFDFQIHGLMNDDLYKCRRCEKMMQCFTEDGDTGFCPCCGCRADNFDTISGVSDE